MGSACCLVAGFVFHVYKVIILLLVHKGVLHYLTKRWTTRPVYLVIALF